MEDQVIDLKLKYQQDKFEGMLKQNTKEHGLINQALINLDTKLDTLVEKMDTRYVKAIEFAPIRNVVYGMVGFILLAFLSAIIGFVIVK